MITTTHKWPKEFDDDIVGLLSGTKKIIKVGWEWVGCRQCGNPHYQKIDKIKVVDVKGKKYE